jgi:peptidoglycan hydrolase-like protein with peptidoglycan-binding domain
MAAGEPVIPETIIVHHGNPSNSGENYTVSFRDYVKNVASSEIYPTWPDASLRANIYVIITYALNRIYTEWYRAKGYDFDITDTTQYDQKFNYGSEYFENIGIIVDEIIDSYIRRVGAVQPLFAAFCNGTTTTCNGLSQWGTVDLANRGYTPLQILKYYYGNDIEIVEDVKIQGVEESYPYLKMEEGSFSNAVRYMQILLNRISRNYPGIPKIPEVNGEFGPETTAAVRKFQEVFNMPVTGKIDKATWYKITYIYNSVKKLSELNAEGLSLEDVGKQYVEPLSLGMQSDNVRIFQYFLAVVAAYYARVTPLAVTGYFDTETENSVKSFQSLWRLPVTGVVDKQTFFDIYNAYEYIIQSIPFTDGNDIILYPGVLLHEGITSDYVKVLQNYLTYIHNTYPEIPAVNNTGYFGPLTKTAVSAFQRTFGIKDNGIVGAITWDKIASVYSDLKYGYIKNPAQNPGYIIQ